ncbi:hypothetical protein ACTJJ0_34340 [Chitinophaga sp. 22321]|uniref:Uncharacterized protein n=1 Tax=Chitinophaga hostae TaxID=2831022 RepID=A0ABS5JCN4_9BACT|nr:hypothetical protein [Chitinophaga hostae]MBS0032387.1 hypothetical protein [Chitinophaga hostae]
MNNLNDPNIREEVNKQDDDDDAPSWGGVIVGLLLGIAGIVLIFYRYQQFHSPGNDSISITKIEMLIYKVTGESIWALIAAYALVAVAGFYLAISNFSKLRSR